MSSSRHSLTAEGLPNVEAMMTLTKILRANHHDVALVIGNGIHRYGPARTNSWDALLITLASRYGMDVDHVPEGASATEFFDVLDLHAQGRNGELANAFCAFMSRWKPLEHHRRIMRWAVKHDVPVLTTNFDDVLSNAVDAHLMRPEIKGFTDFYPWDSRFAQTLYDDPCAGFGVWHINGMARYSRSIRLGLTHYMGSVQRARGWLHRGETRLFDGKDRDYWPGCRTWMHLIFNKPLLIFGLGLRENEVFLRWLLIERARYFAKFPERRRAGWFIFTHDPDDRTETGRHFFLEGVGIHCIEVRDYAAIYDNSAWGE
jgi:hypothetical protein